MFQVFCLPASYVFWGGASSPFQEEGHIARVLSLSLFWNTCTFWLVWGVPASLQALMFSTMRDARDDVRQVSSKFYLNPNIEVKLDLLSERCYYSNIGILFIKINLVDIG